MGVYYLDTSALVKLYVREAGTRQMMTLASPAQGHTLAVLGLTRVEFRAAVRRRERAGDLRQESAEGLIAMLDGHLQTLYLVQPFTEEVLEQTAALLDRHPLRAYDAIQLAGCVALQSKVSEQPWFVCCDRDLLEAAEQEGFDVLDPSA